MNEELVMITRRFPYFKTEAFIESEIKYTAENFEKVLIIPTEISSTHRTIPNNVIVNDNLSTFFSKKIYRSIKTLFSKIFWKTLFDHTPQIKTISDLKRIFIYSSGFSTFTAFFEKNLTLLENKVIYTYWLNEAAYSLAHIRKKHNVKFKLVSRAHRYDLYEGTKDTFNFWPYRRQLLLDLDAIYVISEDGKKFLQQKYDVKDNIIVSKLGIFDRNVISRKSEPEKVVFISVSRITKLKRVALIFSSLKEFATRNPKLNIKWIHFGNGPEMYSLEKEIKRITNPNIEIQLKGYVENEKIYTYYENNNVDIFINLSTSEGIPVSIMEAQSFGIPILATDVGGTSEIVNSQVGYLLDANPTIDQIVNAIDSIIKNKPDSKDIKKYWAKNFNANTNYKSFSESLKSI